MCVTLSYSCKDQRLHFYYIYTATENLLSMFTISRVLCIYVRVTTKKKLLTPCWNSSKSISYRWKGSNVSKG